MRRKARFFFSSRRRHTRSLCDWSSDVCSSDLIVVVNRGFVPEGRQDPKTRAEGQPSGVIDTVGAMRWPEARGTFTPNDQPDKNLWFARDPAVMAAAKKWGDVAPFYVDQEAPSAPGGLPKVGP